MFTEREFKENPFIRAVAKRAATLAREKAMEKGMEQGQAFSVLEVLKARRMKISEAQKKRILKTTDRKTLTRWLRLAATSDNAAALFRQ